MGYSSITRKRVFSVLVVEDDPSTVEMIRKRVVETEGYEGYYARDVKGAKNILEFVHIDVLVLDIRLVGSSGIELIQFINKDMSYRHIKVIFLTQLVDLDTRIMCFKLGAIDYLPKPFFPDELRLRIERLLYPNRESSILTYENHHFQLNYSKYELVVEEVMVKLNFIQNEIIYHLINSKGSTSTVSLTKKIVVRGEMISVNNLRVEIFRINEKCKKSFGHKIIKKSWKADYYLCL